MATIRKGNSVTLFDNVIATPGTESAVLEVSDSVGSLTLYVIVPSDGSVASIALQTASSDSFTGRWADLVAVSASGSGDSETKVGFAPGQVLFVRARITGGGGSVTAIVVAR